MLIASDFIRGSTEIIILAHLMKEDSYGYKINKSISDKTNGQYELKEATLYTVFKRLEDMEMIVSYWGDENKAARRRYYKITDLGKKFYEESKKEWEDAQNVIAQLIEI
ncbi:MAG: PadR family transcriptional regulator [Lachnospiraceae bacterium]|nr:PadR family transcriptional regulator [Lachnospiraceae bacterium]